MRMPLVMTRLSCFGVLLLMSAGLGAQSSAEEEILDPKLVGNRFPPLQWAEMSEAQKEMTRNILAGPRTSLGGPFNVMLRAPPWATSRKSSARKCASAPGLPRRCAKWRF
jgi:hypothetical protein